MPVVHHVIRKSALLTILLCAMATANAADCSITSTGDIPLYPSIFVPRTAEEQSAGLAAANSIPAGSTVLLSIGMSNAKGVWDVFKSDAAEDPLKNPDVQVVNGAQPGGAVESWAEKDLEKTWGELDESLGNAGVARRNVSVIWFMIANVVNHSPLDEYSTKLESDTREALDLFATEFPNLKVVWLQSMIYAGYSTASGNQEPHARESGLVAQRLLVDQSWPFFVGHGPYLWADGTVPRDDGLTWLCSDFKADGNHPDLGAKRKFADRLAQFFHEDSVASIGYRDAGALLTVPDVVGLLQATAESSIVSASLVVGAVSTANSDTVVAGSVISQSPTGGSSAASGTAVDLVVSLGPGELTTVPDVVSLDQAIAESSIVSASLLVGTVSTANSDTVVAGSVISQSPTGGSSVSSGTTVDLVVSLGPVTGVPMMTSPADGSTLLASSETFTWSAEGAAVTNWRLEIGTSAGARDLYSKTFAATETSQLVTGLPTDGSTVFVSLKWRIGGVTSVASYVYTATGGGPPTPAMTSPTPGSTLALGDVSFTWTSNGAVADDWQLLVGTSVGDNNLYDSGVLPSSTTSAVVSGLPEDGSTLHVTLIWTDGGTPTEANYTYTAASTGGGGGVPMMLSPLDGAVLSGSSETFTWSAEGAAVTKWRLEVGTSPNGRDLFVTNLDVATTSILVSGLPTDGSIVYVNLKWRIGGVTSDASYVYTASMAGQ